MSDSSAPHVLFCAFSEVPGASSAGTRTAQWLSVFGNREVDALSLKGSSTAHIERLAGARMMRVPNTSGKPYLERLATYERALQRQLQSDGYDVIWCADLLSAGVVARTLKTVPPLVVEIAEVPSQHVRKLLGQDDVEVRKRWKEQERLAIKAAAKIILPSRNAARLVSERIDPRLLLAVPRVVDRTVFSAPSVELALDDGFVVIFGGREGGPMMKIAIGLAQALAATLGSGVRIGILGQPSAADAELKAMLAQKRLGGRVELVDASEPLVAVGALSQASVVVVPSAAELDQEPFAVPHRALEAMACARAVVLTGSEAAFRETVASGEHLMVSPAGDPNRVADLVEKLLADHAWRDGLARAGSRLIEKSADLEARSVELQRLIEEATGVSLRRHAPRYGDELTSSQVGEPGPAAPQPFARAVALPLAPPLAPAGKPPAEPGMTSGPKRRTADPARSPPATQRPEMSTLRLAQADLGSLEPDGVWDGDTFLEANAPRAPDSGPNAARVRAAMLVSSAPDASADVAIDSSLLQSRPSAGEHDDDPPLLDESFEGPFVADRALADDATAAVRGTTDEHSAETSGTNEDAEHSATTRRRRDRSVPTSPSAGPELPSVPVSLIVEAALMEPRALGSDPWAGDTIADGGPVDLPRGESSGGTKIPIPRSLLADSHSVEGTVVKKPELTTQDVPSSEESSAG